MAKPHVNVRSYTRSDGTRVSGYSRGAPTRAPSESTARPRTVGHAQKVVHRDDFVHYSQRHHVKDGSKAGYHLEWQRHKRRVKPETPDALAKLKERIEKEKPGTRLKPKHKADLGHSTEREKRRTISDIPDFEDDILNYIEPIPDDLIDITYDDYGDIEIWVREYSGRQKGK